MCEFVFKSSGSVLLIFSSSFIGPGHASSEGRAMPSHASAEEITSDKSRGWQYLAGQSRVFQLIRADGRQWWHWIRKEEKRNERKCQIIPMFICIKIWIAYIRIVYIRMALPRPKIRISFPLSPRNYFFSYLAPSISKKRMFRIFYPLLNPVEDSLPPPRNNVNPNSGGPTKGQDLSAMWGVLSEFFLKQKHFLKQKRGRGTLLF